MTEKEIREIYDRLLELTKSRAIRWKRSGYLEYSVSFSRSSVAVAFDDFDGHKSTVLKVFNEDGVLVACATTRSEIPELDEGVEQFTFDPSELFYLVQDEVYKYSETSENILNELRELELQKGR
jgi:hypothetical protein